MLSKWFTFANTTPWFDREVQYQPQYQHQMWTMFNSTSPEQNGRLFADDTFRCISLKENFWIFIRTSLIFISTGPTRNESALVRVTAWRQTGEKPLSEPNQCWPSSQTHTVHASRRRWVGYEYNVYVCHCLNIKIDQSFCVVMTWRWSQT